MLPWPPLQGRCVDGAPTLRIPSCAGECPSPLMSANTRLTEPRETHGHNSPLNVNKPNRATGRDNTSRLDTASRLHTSRHQRPPRPRPFPAPPRSRAIRPRPARRRPAGVAGTEPHHSRLTRGPGRGARSAAKRAAIEDRLNKLSSPFRSAESLWIEEINDPRDTRPLLVEFANLTAPLREPGPYTQRIRP